MNIQWIGLRPGRKEALKSVLSAEVNSSEGLVGDHYNKDDGRRQVTLIHSDALKSIGEEIGQGPVDPGLTRRNLVISGGNGSLDKGTLLNIGDEVQLEITGPCNPCSRMEENLGKTGFHAMAGMGGWTARVVRGGSIRVDDAIQF